MSMRGVPKCVRRITQRTLREELNREEEEEKERGAIYAVLFKRRVKVVPFPTVLSTISVAW
jgi:hypothetical protein